MNGERTRPLGDGPHRDVLGIRIGSDEPRYTHLTAWVIEEEDGYTVQVRLHHEARSAHAAWGEEISDSLEMASALLHALAAKFSIPQSRVAIRLRLEHQQDGTRH